LLGLSEKRYRCWIIIPPKGWQPKNWDDNPKTGKCLSPIGGYYTLERTQEVAQLFNERQDGEIWAMIIHKDQEPIAGDVLDILDYNHYEGN